MISLYGIDPKKGRLFRVKVNSSSIEPREDAGVEPKEITEAFGAVFFGFLQGIYRALLRDLEGSFKGAMGFP